MIIPVKTGAKVHSTAIVDDVAVLGNNTMVWHFCHVCRDARIGVDCALGQNVFVAPHVQIGDRCKIQNNVSLYTGVELEDDVFLGPSCVLTNVSNPRAQVNRRELYEKTLIRRGATIGANATIVCGVTIGQYAFVAAGTVVTHDVPDYGFVMGVPGKQHGWVSRHGHRLKVPTKGSIMICPESGYRYTMREGHSHEIYCLDLAEDKPLSDGMAVGAKSYREFK